MGFPKCEVVFTAHPPPAEKDAIKLRCVEVHPAKPWVACVDEGDVVTVWDFDREELVGRYTPQALREQQLEYDKTNQLLRATVQAGQPIPQGLEAVEDGGSGGGGSSYFYDRALRTGLSQNKVGGVTALGFWDADYVCSKLSPLLSSPPPLASTSYALGEWIIIITEYRFIMVDALSGECRHLTSHDINPSKHVTVTSVEAVGYGTLALGCSDGHLRLWAAGGKAWGVQGPAMPGHVREVVRVAAIMPQTAATEANTGVRLVTLGLEGTLLLWKTVTVDEQTQQMQQPHRLSRGSSNVVDESSPPPLAVPPALAWEGQQHLRLIARLEGAVPLKGEASVRPDLMYNRYTDTLSIMDVTRTVSVWELHHRATTTQTRGDGGPTSSYQQQHRKRGSSLAMGGAGTPKAGGTGQDAGSAGGSSSSDVVVVVNIPRAARYKPPASVGKLHDITTAIHPQFPSRAYVACDKTGVLHVMDDAAGGGPATEDLPPSQAEVGGGRDSPRSEDTPSNTTTTGAGGASGGGGGKTQLSIIEDFDLRPLISSDKQQGSGRGGGGGVVLKVLTVRQHPSRSHTFVVSHNMGLAVLLLDRHVQRNTASLLLAPQSSSSLLVFEQNCLIRAAVRTTTTPQQQQDVDPPSTPQQQQPRRQQQAPGQPLLVPRTGVVSLEVTLASDLVPVTSGPGVNQATAPIGGGGSGMSAAEASLARQNAARKRPDLLVSRSFEYVAVFWSAVSYYVVLRLPSTTTSQETAPPSSLTRSSSNVSTSSSHGRVPPLSTVQQQPGPVPSSSSSPGGSSKGGAGGGEIDVGPALAIAWIGGPGKQQPQQAGGSSSSDILVVVSPGAEVRVGGGGEGKKKKSSLLPFRNKSSSQHAGEGENASIYVPAKILVKELKRVGGGGSSGDLASPSSSSVVVVTLLTIATTTDSSISSSSPLPTNPFEALGGHRDVVLLGWLPDNLPPADDREHLRQMRAQCFLVDKNTTQASNSSNVVKLCKLGSVLPPVVSLCWDDNGQQCCVVTLEHGVHIYTLTTDPQQQDSNTNKNSSSSGGGGVVDLTWTASLRLTSPMEVPMSVCWHHGSLFVATQSSLHLVLVPPPNGADGSSSTVDDLVLANHSHHVAPWSSLLKVVVSQPLEDTTEEVVLCHCDPGYHSESRPFHYMWDSMRPHAQHKPRGQVQILGMLEGCLLVRPSPHSPSVVLLSLEHPVIRASMLLAAGHVKRAVAWAKAVEPHLHDDVALQVFDPRGPKAVQAALKALSGISLGVALDLCIRHCLTAPLCHYLTSARDVIDLLDQVDLLQAADPAGTAYVKRRAATITTPTTTYAAAAGASGGPATAASVPPPPAGGGLVPMSRMQSTIRRVAVVLALGGQGGEVVVRQVLLPACRRRGRGEDAAFMVHLLKDKKLSKEVLLEAGQVHVAALLRHSYEQTSLGLTRGEEMEGLLKKWQETVSSSRPAALFGDLQLLHTTALS